MSTKIQPDILKYQDYSLFLNDFVRNKKLSDINWSLGACAKSLDLKSTSSISKVLNKERAPGKKITTSLISYFKFNNKEKLYFQDLINIEKTKNDPNLKSILLKRLVKNGNKNPVQFIDLKTFEIISNWFHYAIREMSRLKKFNFDHKWISSHLRFNVSEQQVKVALENLTKVNLIKVKNRKITLSPGNLSTTEDIQSLAIQEYHSSMIEHAKQGLKEVPVDEREYLSGTLSFKKENLPQAKELLRNFLDEFGSTMDSDAGDEIYQIQLQFFPLSKTNKKDKKNEIS